MAGPDAPIHPLFSTRADDLRGRRVHLIGIGGAGMSGIAHMLLEMRARVSGSDAAPFPGMADFAARGASVTIGHRAALVDDGVDLVIMTAAIPAGNPELEAARQMGIPVCKYAEFVGRLAADRTTVAIAGTHGKSTTTGMTAHVMRECALNPSFILGARSDQLGGGSGLGAGPHFIVEACEFDRSFLRFRPRLAAILNVEPDHLDCFRDLDDIVSAFGAFASQVERDGVVVCNGMDACAIRAARFTQARVETFAIDAASDWTAVNLRETQGRFSFDVLRRGVHALSTSLAIPGRHNVANALAAIALAHHAGASCEGIAGAVRSYRGVDRRLSLRGVTRGVTVLDDYAHHPTEVRVTLDAARKGYDPRRMWVVFQPHQCTRTRKLMAEFAESFGEADQLIILDVYGAREGDAAACREAAVDLVDSVRRAIGRARHAESFAGAVDMVLDGVEPGDAVVTMGAGDVWKVANELLEGLGKPDRARRAVGASNVVSTRGSGAVVVSST